MEADGNNLQKILDNHSDWILSLGKTGIIADLNSRNLDEANLEMVNLPFAKFHFVSLKNANLSKSKVTGLIGTMISELRLSP